MSDQDPIDRLRELLTSAIGCMLRIDDREKHPLRSVYGEDRTADQVTPDERARLRHFDADERQRLAKVALEISSMADWSAVVEEWGEISEARSREARRLYDERMAAKREESAS